MNIKSRFKRYFSDLNLFFGFQFSTKTTKQQKATTTIATTAFPGTALVQPTLGLIAGDRGCLPTISLAIQSGSVPQTATQQLTLGTGPKFTIDGAINDFGSWVILLCLTSGTCCTTSGCNRG